MEMHANVLLLCLKFTAKTLICSESRAGPVPK
jgi:hypothetical protein